MKKTAQPLTHAATAMQLAYSIERTAKDKGGQH
jgi:hypothetical protein